MSDVSTSPESGPRLLIAAGEAAADVAELPALVRALIERATEVLVMTPALVGRLQWLASDVDRARYEADERLSAVLGQVERVSPGTPASGEVGADDPLTALDDAVRRFRPDHILIAIRASDHSAWQERNLVESVLERFHVPVTVFELDRAGDVPA